MTAYLTRKLKIAIHDGDGALTVYETFDDFANDTDHDDAFVAAVAAALGRPHVVDLDI